MRHLLGLGTVLAVALIPAASSQAGGANGLTTLPHPAPLVQLAGGDRCEIWASKCAWRWGPGTWRFSRCMWRHHC